MLRAPKSKNKNELEQSKEINPNIKNAIILDHSLKEIKIVESESISSSSNVLSELKSVTQEAQSVAAKSKQSKHSLKSTYEVNIDNPLLNSDENINHEQLLSNPPTIKTCQTMSSKLETLMTPSISSSSLSKSD